MSSTKHNKLNNEDWSILHGIWCFILVCADGILGGLHFVVSALTKKNEIENDLSSNITFIRHGQAHHNVNWRKLDERDTELTEIGIGQVNAQRDKILEECPTYFDDIDLIVCSPLIRAVHTLFILIDNQCKKYSDKILISSLAAERGNKLCDIGCSKEKLSMRYPQIKALKSWMQLSEEWWIYPENVSAFEKRMNNFKIWIQSRKEKKILIVTHHGVIHALTSINAQNAQLVCVDELC